jgi:hypothetical protein
VSTIACSAEEDVGGEGLAAVGPAFGEGGAGSYAAWLAPGLSASRILWGVAAVLRGLCRCPSRNDGPFDLVMALKLRAARAIGRGTAGRREEKVGLPRE